MGFGSKSRVTAGKVAVRVYCEPGRRNSVLLNADGGRVPYMGRGGELESSRSDPEPLVTLRGRENQKPRVSLK
jgi:hypothetical protein